MVTDRRDLLRIDLLDRARADPRIVGAAIVGSAASGGGDQWSDVDLFFGVADTSVADVLHDFTAYLYEQFGALHHFDLTAGRTTYRAFLLDAALEVDLGFAPASEFRSRGDAPFDVIFGDPAPPSPENRLDVDHLTGLIWHHVRHARASIERGRSWQAEYWISQARNHVLTLVAHRHGLDTAYARGADSLPDPLKATLSEALVRDVDAQELNRGLQAVTRAALSELHEHDGVTAERLHAPLLALSRRTDDQPQ